MSKISLILFGLLVVLAVFATAENEEQSLSEKLSSLRVVRDADAGRKKMRKNKNRKSKRKNNKRKNKRKNNKRKNKKNNRQNDQNDQLLCKDGQTICSPVAPVPVPTPAPVVTPAPPAKCDGKCIEKSMIAMSRWMTQVANFNKQKTRIEKQTAIAEKKAEKMDVFAPVAKKLINVGGGNKSALTCSGSADSAGAVQLANLTMKLEECAMKINASCNMDDFPKPDPTTLEACTASVASFETKAQECLDLSKEDSCEDACGCWESSDMDTLSEEVKSCKIAETQDVAKALKECKAAFSECRKLEDETIDSIALCSQTAAELQAKASALKENKDAVDDVKAKITAAKSRRRHARAAATDCAGFLPLVVECKYHNWV